MSETEEAAEAPAIWRVKKMPDGDIYGPVDETTLKEWAGAAQISPEDLIDTSDENWRAAPEYPFLEMVWVIKLPGEELYGPTSIGTLREFIAESLISDKSIATNVVTTQSLPVGALFAALDFEKAGRAPRRPGAEQVDRDDCRRHGEGPAHPAAGGRPAQPAPRARGAAAPLPPAHPGDAGRAEDCPAVGPAPAVAVFRCGGL